MGLRILSDERADVVMLAFGITTATAAERESVLEKALAGRLARLLGTVVPVSQLPRARPATSKPSRSGSSAVTRACSFRHTGRASARLQGPG